MQNACNNGCMSTVQIRDVPDDTLNVLRQRADAEGRSLAGYLRDLLVAEASSPTLAEAIDAIREDEPINYDPDFVRDAINEGRR